MKLPASGLLAVAAIVAVATPCLALDRANAQFYWSFDLNDVIASQVNTFVPNNQSYVNAAGKQVVSAMFMHTLRENMSGVWSAIGVNEWNSGGTYYADFFVQYTGTDGAAHYNALDGAVSNRGDQATYFWERVGVNGTQSSTWQATIYKSTGNRSLTFTTLGDSIKLHQVEVSNFQTCADSVTAAWWYWIFKNAAGNWYYNGNSSSWASNTNSSCTANRGVVSGGVGPNLTAYTWLYN